MKVYIVQEVNCDPKLKVPEISEKIFSDVEVAKNFFLEQVIKNCSVIVRVGYKKVLQKSFIFQIWHHQKPIKL